MYSRWVAIINYTKKYTVDFHLFRINTFEMFVWTDKVCIITGGCTGIGWAFVQNVMEKGAKCLFTDLHYYQAGEERVEKLQKEYGKEKVVYYKMDIDSAFENCIQVFGRVDVLINCHGINQEISWPMKLKINLLVRMC